MGYVEARSDCQETGDDLLQIDTVEELDQITTWLQDLDQTVSLVWVGGTNKISGESYTWENGEPINDTLWASGEPCQLLPNYNVAAEISGPIVQLKVQNSAEETRYICEEISAL